MLSVNKETNSTSRELRQAFLASREGVPSQNLIDELARSSRGDDRAIAALLTIEIECAFETGLCPIGATISNRQSPAEKDRSGEMIKNAGGSL
jgi:hypothetical protein